MKTKNQKLTFEAFAAKAKVDAGALSKINAGTLGGCGGGGMDPKGELPKPGKP